MLPVSLGCPFLITHSVFSNVYYGHKLLRRDQKSDEVYSIQYYVIKFLRDLATGRWFSPGTHVSSTDKTDLHDITKILLKGVLNTITLNPRPRQKP